MVCQCQDIHYRFLQVITNCVIYISSFQCYTLCGNAKTVGGVYSRRSELLKHYKLNHKHYGRGSSYPCTFLNCVCRFKTWNALLSHLSRSHPVQRLPKESLTTFNCQICSYQLSSERDYFQHIFHHLKNKETIKCMYKDCTYKTNVYVNFKSHKHRKHCGASNFKPGVVENKIVNSVNESFESVSGDISDDEITCSNEPVIDSDPVNLEKEIEFKLALVLLKLENIYLVLNTAIDELLQELSYLIGTVSLPITQKTLNEILQTHSCEFDQSIVEKLANVLCESNAIKKAIGHRGPLSNAWRRKSYFKRHFNVVEPVEFVLDPKEKKTFQYISIIKSLQQILECQTVLDHARNLNNTDELKQQTKQKCSVQIYNSFYDGAAFKANEFLCKQESISLILYIDEFEICNPLGTSRQKHKICGIYWVLGNLPPLYH